MMFYCNGFKGFRLGFIVIESTKGSISIRECAEVATDESKVLWCVYDVVAYDLSWLLA